MYVVRVDVRVKADHLQDFIEATIQNATLSRQEVSCFRFDIMQNPQEPDSFMLYEVYRDAGGLTSHKETAHYATWRDAVAPWMASARESIKYESIYPATDADW